MFRRTSHIAPALISAAFLLLVACGGGGEEGAATGGNSSTPGTGGSTGSGSGGTGTGSATLSWIPPAENTDGSSVTTLAGYHVYRGTSQGSLALAKTIANPGITTVVLDGLATGTHYFAVSAYLTSGAESDPSSIGSKSIP
jgi:hypothetical protein